MNVVGSDSTESSPRGRRIGVHVDLDVGNLGQLGADVVDDPSDPGAGSAPLRAEVHDRGLARRQPQVGGSAADGVLGAAHARRRAW